MKLLKRPASRPLPHRTGLVVAVIGGGLVGALVTLGLVSPSPTASFRVLSQVSAALQPSAAEAHYPAVDLADIAEKATVSVVNISSTKVVRGDDRGQEENDGAGGPMTDDPAFRRFFQLPPGRGMLATNPLPTGSATTTNTIGTVRVPCTSCSTTGVLWPTITSG